MNRISFLNRGYAFKGLLAVYMKVGYSLHRHVFLMLPVLKFTFPSPRTDNALRAIPVEHRYPGKTAL